MGPTRTALTELYDKYIAEPHQHQWSGGGFGRTRKHILGSRIHTDGAHSGQYHLYQNRLTRELLFAMELFKDEPIEFRRKVYRDLIECKDREAYERVRQLLTDMRTTPEGARKLYESYRQQKTNGPGRRQ